MKIIITCENINRYRYRYQYQSNELVDEIVWEAGPLDGSVLKNFPKLKKLNCSKNNLTTLTGIENCPLLQKLYCIGNKLTTLTGIENCTQLQKLVCSHNKLTTLTGIENCTLLQILDCSNNELATLTGINSCTQLQILWCSNNNLTTLTGIENCTLLQELYCYDNNLITLTEIKNCTLLQVLYCSHNKLTTLTGIENCTQLQELYCSGNNLTTLTGIESCTLLQILYCSDNNLTTLTGIESCTELQELGCSNNEIERLDSIVYLRHLNNLDTDNNPLAIQTIQVQRFLQRIRRVNQSFSVYSDTQNVHNTTIQKSVCRSIQNLLQDPKPSFTIDSIIQSNLNQKVKEQLIEYCSDTTEHSVHLLTYFDLLSYVWVRIEQSEHSKELYKILSEQIQDSECKCFTGRFNRTLSVLVGFYPDIIIEISDNDRISAIVLALREQYADRPIDEQKALIRTALIDSSYDEDTISVWLEPLDDFLP